jgi:hypothetical protein
MTGNVYVAGQNASSQAFVAQLNPSGALQWTQTTSTTSGGSAGANGVAVYDAPNNGPESVYAIGSYGGTVTVGATTMTNATRADNIFTWKLNSDGTTVQAANQGSLGISGTYNHGRGITVDGAGNPYVTGDLWGTSGIPIFVAKLDPTTLKSSWISYFSFRNTPNGAYGTAVAVDQAGIVYTTGFFSGTYDFDPGPGTYYLKSGVTHGPVGDVFVAELNTQGHFVAAVDMHATSNSDASIGNAIALDNSSPGAPNVYTTGQLNGTANFNPTGTYLLTAKGTYDVFVSKLTQTASSLLATPAVTLLADAPTFNQSVVPPVVPGSVPDLALALLFTGGSVPAAAPFVPDGSSRVLTESQLVAPGVLRISQTSATSTPTLQAALSRSPATGALDLLFTDLVNGGLANALAADALLAPPA